MDPLLHVLLFSSVWDCLKDVSIFVKNQVISARHAAAAADVPSYNVCSFK